jgi:2-methylcitrate dehydratase PrpD
LAEFAATTTPADPPPEVLEAAKLVLLDTIGVILGGSRAEEAAALAGRLGGNGDLPCTIVGAGRRAAPMTAALVNGTAGTWLDFDSGHLAPPGTPLLAAGHPPVHVTPAALAMAEATGASGADLLVAFLVGYDVAARIGISSRIHPQMHPHGTYVCVGPAVAAARLLGFDDRRIASAIGISAGLTLMPSFENAYQGFTVRNNYAGVGSASGILAARLAESGVTPETDAIGTVFGEVSSSWHDPALLLEDLGERFEVMRGYIKPFPSCRYSHPAVEATRDLVNRHDIDPAQIREVRVDTYDLAVTLAEREPASELGAKFSIPHQVAAVLVRGSIGPDEYRDEALGDPTIRGLSRKTAVVEDPAMTAVAPEQRPARVTVTMVSGIELAAEVERSSGGPDLPMPDEEVLGKFRSLAAPVLGAERTEELIAGVTTLEESADVASLIRLLAV